MKVKAILSLAVVFGVLVGQSKGVDPLVIYDRAQYKAAFAGADIVAANQIGESIWNACAISGFSYKATEYFQCGGQSHWMIVVKHATSGVEFCLIPGGIFSIGDYNNIGNASEKPLHPVSFKPFLIGRTEITQGQWRATMGTEPWKNQLWVYTGAGADNCAANYLSWNDAVSCCNKLNWRLPSEAEREYACRAGTTSPFYFGYNNNNELEDYAWVRSNAWDIGHQYAHPSGTNLPNAFGLFDMHGNLWEWTRDVWHDNYDGAPIDGNAWVVGGHQDKRVVRDSAFESYPFHNRSARRYPASPDHFDRNGGFRPVVSVSLRPNADAGPDQVVNEFTQVTLDGSGTNDPDSAQLSYSWVQIPNSTISLDLSNPIKPTFLAPQVPMGGLTLTFVLTVSDGVHSSSDEVNITVANVNHVPVADAGDNQTVNENTSVTLDGSQSYDPDAEPLTYLWAQQSGPAVVLSDPTAAKPMFTAPFVGQTGGVLVFKLVVNDGIDNSTNTDNLVTITVENVNHDPVASAGPDQAKDEGSLVTLDGSASADPDQDFITPVWIQTAGTPVTLSSYTTWNPTFTAPLVSCGGETLTFKLIVNDGLIDSEPDYVDIKILNVNDPPITTGAFASPSKLWPPNHKLVEVKILGVSDPNSDRITITVTGVTQDEPVNGLGDGDTGPDAVIIGNKLYLRAERSGTGNGRVYKVTFKASDGCAEQVGTVLVTVPHSRKGAPAVDDGQKYDSRVAI